MSAVHRPAAGGLGAERLRAHKDRILLLWEERLREEVPAAGEEPQLILINTLPALLDQLAEALTPDHPRRTATDGSTAATEHGGERIRLTHFRLEDVITEYRLLRQVLFEVLEADEPLAAEDRNTLNASLDQALMEACTGYALVQSSFRDQLFATVAHDLRNPLNAAHMTAQLIVRMPGAEQVSHLAERIVDNLVRVDRMIQELLDAMRVQAGARLQLNIAPCDLVEVVRRSLQHFAAEHSERFVVEAPEPVPGHFDREAIRRAVENLATNGLRYGAPSRPITVAVRQKLGRVFVTVHNHGAHIPVEKQETLFRAFQRMSGGEQSSNRGWGLGLAQARAVAEAHGGSIAVDSLPERGTTFIIDIPIDARPFQKKPITEPAAE